MKKICLLIPTLNSGGIEMYVLRFLRFCKEKEKKLDITVIVKNGEKGVLYDDYMTTEADVILLKTGYFNIYSWIKVYNLFKKAHFETICDFTANFAGIYVLLAKYAGIKNRIAFYRQASNLFKSNCVNNSYD